MKTKFVTKVSGIHRRIGVWSLVFIWNLVLGVGCFSQPLSNLVFTVGTTTRDGANRDWSYVLLTTPQPHLLAGKRFAVYSKTGYPTNAGAFALRATVFQQADPGAINALLNQSIALGQSPTALNSVLNAILHKVPGITNQSLPQKVAMAFQVAAADPGIAEVLGWLGNVHPGFHLCAGRAFSEPITTVTTYEVREVNPANSSAGDVLGRVTVVPGSYVVLPAPGRPFQLVTNHPSDHLLVRLRWGTPPELRRLSLLSFGFNVWRIPRAAAESAGFHLTPPTLAQLRSSPHFRLANGAPVIATMHYSTGTGAGAADDPADRRTYFLAEDGRASGVVFADGDEFYHFVTARDLLGRDGLVSPGRLTRACRRIPPEAPREVRVVNAAVPGGTNGQRLRVEWDQNLDAADQVTHYWVYRWPNPTMALTNDATPLSNRVGVVTHLPGTNRNALLDDTAGAYTSAGLSNIWYTVRAISQAACDPLWSPHAGPASGVLRQRAGPDGTTGTLVGSCGTPAVIFEGQHINPIASDPDRWHIRLTCQRRDPGIAWVSFTVFTTRPGVGTTAEAIGPVYFPPEGDRAEIDYAIPALDAANPPQASVRCEVGTFHHQLSPPADIGFTLPVPPGLQKEIVFFAGQLLESALSSSDPLLRAVGGLGICRPATSAVPDASGMVAVRFDFSPGTGALIQARTNGVWSDVGMVTSDPNGIFWVYYPACLVGPVPPFQACLVNLPTGANCSQHITTAAGARAPVRARFRLQPRTREYRVYRRVNDGPMTLFAQGAAAYDPSNAHKLIEAPDEALPSSAARLCYFVQLLDEHGNGSPMSFLGCRESMPERPPRPVLAEPMPVGNTNNPQVALTWFCPTSGVSRFEILIKRLDPPTPDASNGFFSVKLRRLPGYNQQTSYLGLRPRANARKYLAVRSQPLQTFDEIQVTPPIGSEFGPGPQFTLTASVLLNARYEFSVRAIMDDHTPGPASEVWPFQWTPVVMPASVPWPARPLPPVTDFDFLDATHPPSASEFQPRVAAVALTFPGSPNDLINSRYPVMIRIGELDGGTEPWSNVGNDDPGGDNPFVQYFFTSPTGINPNPNVGVFSSRTPDAARAGQRLLPIVVYRQQVTNEAFPRVSGDIVQVTPLIEQIPWTVNGNGEVTIPDRLFAGHLETKGANSQFFLYARDLQPVLEGAKYRYFVVRFNEKREVVEVIPAGEIRIPVQA